MLFKVGNNIVYANLSNDLKNADNQNIFDGRRIISNELDEGVYAIIDKRYSKCYEEGAEIGNSK